MYKALKRSDNKHFQVLKNCRNRYSTPRSHKYNRDRLPMRNHVFFQFLEVLECLSTSNLWTGIKLFMLFVTMQLDFFFIVKLINVPFHICLKEKCWLQFSTKHNKKKWTRKWSLQNITKKIRTRLGATKISRLNSYGSEYQIILKMSKTSWDFGKSSTIAIYELYYLERKYQDKPQEGIISCEWGFLHGSSWIFTGGHPTWY